MSSALGGPVERVSGARQRGAVAQRDHRESGRERGRGSGLRQGRGRGRRGHLWVHLVLSAGAVLMVLPFLWQLLTAFKTAPDAIRVPPTVLPDPWVWQNFTEVFQSIPLGSMLLTSTLMVIGRTAGQVVLCTMAGYAFARLRFPGRDILFLVFLATLMVPSQLFLIPQFEIIDALGWVNTLAALVVPGIFSAFGTFLMRQFFLTIPTELDDAARIDGANVWQTFTRVMLPLASPAVAALTAFTVLWTWNDFLWPLVVTTDASQMPLSVGLRQLVGLRITDYPVLMAASLFATVPLIVTFVLLQRRFTQGIGFSGVR